MLFRQIAGIVAIALTCSPATPVSSQSKPKAASAKKASAPKSRTNTAKKRYLSSVGKPDPQAAVKTSVAKKVVAATRRLAPKRTLVGAAVRAEAHEGVFQNVANGAEIPVENAGALIPFFEQLYRHQKGELPGPLRILHYGDSHTAADEWTGDLRTRFQEKFGDGGSGYSFAGRPWSGYRRLDVRTGSTRGWHSDGLVGRSGDGVYGLGGVSMSATSSHESIYLLAECEKIELFYLQQPGGGMVQIYDNGAPIEQISTDGPMGPAYYHYETTAGSHRFEVETLERAPVRLFGWAAENSTGVTYETLGINGAQASIVMGWDETTLESNIERRNPGLIVLAYGTNEAGRSDWTLESYRDMYTRLIGRLRAAAPTATILVVGPADRLQRTRKGWLPMEKIDMIAEAQRQAAAATGCAFWDLHAKMGGKGSMQQWVSAGMAQNDRVHFTGAGYRMLGDALFRDLMSQYDLFLAARESLAAAVAQEAPQPAH